MQKLKLVNQWTEYWNSGLRFSSYYKNRCDFPYTSWFRVYKYPMRYLMQSGWTCLATDISFRIHYFNYVYSHESKCYCDVGNLLHIRKIYQTPFLNYGQVFFQLINSLYVFRIYMKNTEPVLFHYLKKFLLSRASCSLEVLFLNGKEANNIFTFFADSEKRTPLFPIIPTG